MRTLPLRIALAAPATLICACTPQPSALGGPAPEDTANRGGASGAQLASIAGHNASNAGHGGSTAAAAGRAGVAAPAAIPERPAGMGAGGAAAVGGTTGNAGARSSGGAGGSTAAGAGGAVHANGGGPAPASGATRCPNPDLLLCESFEASSIDSAIWTPMQASPTLDDTRAARGTRSLHVHTSATGAAGLQTSGFFAHTQGHYYGRMFVYFDALPESPQWAHWTIIGANPVASSDDKSEIRVGGQHDGKIERFGVGTDRGPTGDWTNLDQDPKGAVQPVALKRWLCIEWLHDWEHDETRFYLDGTEHPSLATTANVKHEGNASVSYQIPELGSLWIGFWNYNQSKPVTPSQFDVWIDELAIDDARIGCDG